MLTLSNFGRNCFRPCVLAALCLEAFVLVLLTNTAAHAQHGRAWEGAPEPAIFAAPCLPYDVLTGMFPDSGLFNFGGSAWIEHIAGGGPGWQPYTGLGGSVPIPMGNGVLMLEGQGLLTDDGNGSGTIGLNRRFFAGAGIIGAGFWYDVTQSENQNTFHQLSASLEWFPVYHWAFRFNGYVPIGQRSQNVSYTPNPNPDPTTSFWRNNLLATTVLATRVDDETMRAIDLEMARGLGSWTGEGFIGFYHFQGDFSESTNGVKAGVRGYITPRLSGTIAIADDSTFKTNVYGGFAWHFGGRGGNAPRSLRDKLTIPVERNPQIVINESHKDVVETTLLTSGGNPITVTHIRTGAPGLNLGTFENPFRNLPATQGTDIVYVHGGSGFSGENYVLAENQRFLGEGDGNIHLVDTDQFGLVELAAGSGDASRPVIAGAPGAAVEMADNSEVSNFRILGPATFGVDVNDVDGFADIDRTIIEDAPIGVRVLNSSADITISETTITDSSVAAITINGGSANVDVILDSSITQQEAAGTALLVIGGHTGIVNFGPGTSISATQGAGLQFENADGEYNFLGETSLNGGGAGIAIVNNSNGVFLFGADTSVTTTTSIPAFLVSQLGAGAQVDYDGSLFGAAGGGDLVLINTTAPGSAINFNDSGANEITGTAAGGIVIQDANGTVAFTTPVNIDNPINSSLDAGIAILGGNGAVSFADAAVTLPFNNLGTGVAVSNKPGTVTFDSLHVETTGAGNVGLSVIQSDAVNVNGTVISDGATGIAILDSAGTFTFDSDSSLTTTVSGTSAFLITQLRTGSQIDFNGSILGETGGGDLVGINTTAAGSTINFNTSGGNSISGNGAGGIRIQSANGTVAFTTPVEIIDPVNSPQSAGIAIIGGEGDVSFSDTTISLPTSGLDAGVKIANQEGSVSFNNLEIETTGNGTVGFSVSQSHEVTTTGTNSITTTGGAGVQILGADLIEMVFDDITVTNSQDGFGAGNGMTIVGVDGGTFEVTGTTTVDGANGTAIVPVYSGAGIYIDDSTGEFIFDTIDINDTNREGIAVGLTAGNPGTVRINGGLVNDTGTDGVRLINAADFELFDTTFTNTTGQTIDLTGSHVDGTGNVAAPFSKNVIGAGNTGAVFFNNNADQAP